MEITTEQLNTLERLYKVRYGHDLSPDEALELGGKLLTLVQAVYKPIMKDD